MARIPSTKNRNTKAVFGLALVCILLGTGNILVGQYKYTHYSVLLSEANAELARPESSPVLPLLSPALNIDKQTQHITRLKARLNFYGFVILGGQGLLAFGVIWLAAGLLIHRRRDDAGISS